MTTDRCRILLVEDDPDMLDLVREHLQHEGHAVVALGRGADAIARLRAEEFDLVLTDLRLPDVDGMEVLRASRDAQRELPVILITAFGTIETAIQAIRQGAYDYVTKPFALAEISLLVGQGRGGAATPRRESATPGRGGGPVPAAQSPREESRHADRVRPHPPGSPGRRQRPHHRGKRHGQGAGGQGPAFQQRPRRPTLRAGQLCRRARRPPGERAVRPREGGLHGCRRIPARPLPGGRGRHSVPRRDRGHGAGASGQTTPRHRGPDRASAGERRGDPPERPCW